MNTSVQLTKLPGLRRTPGLAEIEGLLELLPGANLLVEARNRRILLANALATELSAYTRAELSGMAFTGLIDNLDEAVFWEMPAGQPTPSTLTLRQRNGAKVEVQATRLDLSPRGKWAIIALEKMRVVEQRQAQQRRRAEMMLSMQTISQALMQPDLGHAIHLMLQAGSEITGAEIMGVYLQDLTAEGQNVELVCYAYQGPENALPERLPPQDLIHLRGPNFWTPGKRSASSLQRAARGAGLSTLVSVPLGQSHAPIGIVAIAGSQSLEQGSVLPRLQVLADAIDGIIQFHMRASNLEESLEAALHARAVDRTSIDSVEDGIVVLTPELTVARINPSAERALGYTSHEAYGRYVDDILIGTGTLTSALQMALQGVPTLRQDDFRLYRRTGQPFLAQISIVPSMVDEKLVGIAVLIRDLSEQEQIQEQAEQLKQRAILGEVAAVFAHEVKNPINNISTGLQLLAFNLSPGDPHQEIVTRLQRDCERLDGLMKTVLNFARPSEYVMEPVNLGLLVGRLLERYKVRLMQANIQHFLQVEASLPLVNGNTLALEQVFINLINNAVEAMGEKGGTLALKVQTVLGAEGKNFVAVDVADTGPGIPKDVLDRLFQPFFTTKQEGNGLGLVITRRILHAHKGTITPTSYPGAAVFHVHIPVMEA
jgi:two-component system sensor histidine kinase AtoS